MENKITPAIMVISSLLVISLMIMASVAVTAYNSSPESRDYVESDALKLVPTIQNSVEDEDESEDVPITGSALERAKAAALNAVGQGRVTDTEIGDEEGYYEIEITLDNGNEVDVHLDDNFNVISKEYEEEEDDD